MEFRKHYSERKFKYILSAPFIYGMIVPIAFADICAEVYHQVCFRLYGIERVKRSNYIKIDRHKLSKLNLGEKINCMYCGYVNGWLGYAREMAARTEKYWCGIRHEANSDFIEPEYQKSFDEREKYQ